MKSDGHIGPFTSHKEVIVWEVKWDTKIGFQEHLGKHVFFPLPTKIMAALHSLAITIKILLCLLSVCVNWPPALILGSHTPSRTITQQTQRDGPCCSPEL